MSIWLMGDNHTFSRLDQHDVDVAMDIAEREMNRNHEYCSVGFKPPHAGAMIHFRPGEPWRERLRSILTEDRHD